MKHLVLNGFVCKESGVYFAPGSFYESEDFKRVKEIESLGFVEANQAISSLEVKRTRKKASD